MLLSSNCTLNLEIFLFLSYSFGKILIS